MGKEVVTKQSGFDQSVGEKIELVCPVELSPFNLLRFGIQSPP